MSWQRDLFEDRTVLITGGTSGIGAGAALRFAELGADVVAVGLGAQSAQVPVHERVRVVELDATDVDAVSALMSGRVRCQADLSLHRPGSQLRGCGDLEAGRERASPGARHHGAAPAILWKPADRL